MKIKPMKFGIILCQHCQRALGFELRFKSTKCPFCITTFKIHPKNIKYQTDTENDLANMISKINHDLESKRSIAFSNDFNSDIEKHTEKSNVYADKSTTKVYENLDPIKRIAIKFKDVPESLNTIHELVINLSRELGEFSENDFRDLLLSCGFDVKKTEEYLEKMKEASILFEPKTGVYKLIIDE